MGYIDKFSIGGTEYDLADTSTIDNICTDVEDGSVASKTYNAGDYILRNGQLHRVTQTISSGSAITEGVNIESATVGGELTNKIIYRDYSITSGTYGEYIIPNIAGYMPISIRTDISISTPIVYNNAQYQAFMMKIGADNSWVVDANTSHSIRVYYVKLV